MRSRPYAQHKSSSGISALEIIVALALVALIVSVLSPVFTAASRSFEKDRKLKELVQTSRDAMDFMVYELKKTNGILDDTNANFASTVNLDSNYVLFATKGEEVYLDNRNSGYSTCSGGCAAGSFAPGTKQSGFAGDYDVVTTGYASYDFKTVLPGDYDIYAYYLPTSPVMNFLLFDNGALSFSTTFDQSGARFATTSLGGSWDQLNRNGTPRVALNLTAGITDTIGVSRFSGAVPGNVDGFKLVYQGFRHKTFFYDSAGSKITYGSDNVGAVGNLANNPTLLSNVLPISGQSFFTFYQSNGTTAATSGSNVALIRIQFQVYDPDGKLAPLQFRGEAEIRSSEGSSGALNKLVINEISYQPSSVTYYSDDMDGNVVVNDVTYANAYPWYSTYNNWYETFDQLGDYGWVKATIGAGGTAPWSRGVPTSATSTFDGTSSASISTVWTTSLTGGNYSSNADERFTSPAITLPATPAGTLYWQGYFSLLTKDAVDALIWEVNDAGFITVQSLTNNGNNNKYWDLHAGANSQGINIDAYAGKNINIGGRFTSDGSKVDAGAYFEDFSIFSTTPTETMAMVTSQNLANGQRTLWSRGRPNTAFKSADNVAHPVCHSGTICWGTMSRTLSETTSRGTAQSYNYPEDLDASLVTPDGTGPDANNYTIDLTAATSPQLIFFQWRDLVNASGYNNADEDGGIVEVCKNGNACFSSPTGAGWTKLTNAAHTLTPDYSLTALTGADNPLGAQTAYGTDLNVWTQTSASLSAFTGAKIKVRWHFGSDRSGGTKGGTQAFNDGHAGGWYIDDIRVTEGCTTEWIELYNPTPYSTTVTDTSVGCNESSLVSCNLANCWRIYSETHKATADAYDNIVPYSGAGGGTSIPGYGYGVVAASSLLYTDPGCTSAFPVPSTATKLVIDDGNFGNAGLPDSYDLITLTDNNGNLEDMVPYNVAFFDDFETAITTSQWSTSTAGGTSWSTGKLVAGDSMADNKDHTTSGTNGYVFGTNMGGNYTNNASAILYDPVLDLSLATTTVTLSFWQRYRLAAGDTMVLQKSTDGGSSWSTLIASPAAGTQTSWTNITNTTLPTASIALLRFNFTSDGATVDTGWYIDDLAAYWMWGGNGNKHTLERVSYLGDSTKRKNWCDSRTQNGTPGAANGTTGCF